MHRTLRINEILRLVFDLLADTGGDRTLADSAVVCQEFREPALDALWRHIHGLLPLISILPIQLGGQTLILAPGEFNDQIWARFDSYAARVRVLTVAEEQSVLPNVTTIHPSVYIRLARARPCILPRLDTMNLMNVTVHTAMELMLCLSNTVRTLRMVPGNDDADWCDPLYNAGTALDALASNGRPNIEELLVCVRLSQSYVDKLLPLQNLRTLRFMQITPPEGTSDLIRKISTLPKLEELHLILLKDAVIDRIPYDGFPSLRCLRIPYSLPQSVTRLLYALPSDRLRDFEAKDPRISQNVQTAPELREILNSWRACFTALARHGGLKTIHITINADAVDEDILQDCQDIRFISLIEPLLAIKGLEDLCVSPPADMPLSDDDVCKIVSALPQLTTLDLCFPTEDDQPTLLSLQHIAKYSPYLESLTVSLDPSVDVPVAASSQGPPHPLKEIQLQSTNIDDIPALVRHLRSLFPNLEDITSCDDDEKAVMDAYRSMEI